MTMIYKALSALLAYPSAELVDALPEITAIVANDTSLPRACRPGLATLIERLRTTDNLDAQEAYVGLFDRGRATSLHLFEHVHGESRERGQAMVDLKSIYAQAGFELRGGELPDYLPALLEYLSRRPAAEATDMLGDCAHILRRVGEALQERDSDYAAVLAALLALIGAPGLGDSRGQAAPLAEPAIDDDWIEEPVHFGPPGGIGCGASRPQQAVVNFTPRRG